MWDYDRFPAIVFAEPLEPPSSSRRRNISARLAQNPSRSTQVTAYKVDTGIVNNCCDLYVAPDPTPKSKTERYNLIIKRFRARSLYLLSLPATDFAKEYRPYMFVFDCLQVVGELVNGWDDGGDSHVAQACKKRTFEKGPAEGDSKSSKWHATEDSDEDL